MDDQFPVSNNENNPMLTLNCNLAKVLNKGIVGIISVTAFLITISALEASQQAIVQTNVPSLSSLLQVLPLINSKPESKIKKGNKRTRIEHYIVDAREVELIMKNLDTPLMLPTNSLLIISK